MDCVCAGFVLPCQSAKKIYHYNILVSLTYYQYLND